MCRRASPTVEDGAASPGEWLDAKRPDALPGHDGPPPAQPLPGAVPGIGYVIHVTSRHDSHRPPALSRFGARLPAHDGRPVDRGAGRQRLVLWRAAQMAYLAVRCLPRHGVLDECHDRGLHLDQVARRPVTTMRLKTPSTASSMRPSPGLPTRRTPWSRFRAISCSSLSRAKEARVDSSALTDRRWQGHRSGLHPPHHQSTPGTDKAEGHPDRGEGRATLCACACTQSVVDQRPDVLAAKMSSRFSPRGGTT